MFGDTIAAVSTPRGKGGVALLRVSGPDAVTVCERVFCPKSGKKLSELPPRTAVYGTVYAREPDGGRSPIDDGIVTVFRAPASFTGEDTAELCCHGGILLTETVLTALICAGARPAEAGEFTRRAFLNGKLGLSAAESLGNILEAKTREQLTLAHNGMNGRVEKKCREIYEELRRVLAGVYVRIDYPDEDLSDMTREEIRTSLDGCAAKLRALADSYRTGHAIAEGISTVICGKPNVGKSSLYNRMVGRDAAIVTDVEGTTRDILTESTSLGRVTLRLCDTAGLHDTENPVEKLGIDRANRALEEAELILAVFDGSRPADERDKELANRILAQNGTVIAVLNKADLGAAEDCFYKEKFQHTVSFSAITGEGIDVLRDTVERLFTDGSIDTGRDAVLANARQQAAALTALSATERASEALQSGFPLDLCCADAEEAMRAISELDGREVSEDIVSEIFSHFCVGK